MTENKIGDKVSFQIDLPTPMCCGDGGWQASWYIGLIRAFLVAVQALKQRRPLNRNMSNEAKSEKETAFKVTNSDLTGSGVELTVKLPLGFDFEEMPPGCDEVKYAKSEKRPINVNKTSIIA